MSRPSLDDYIDVAERIQNFKAEFPKGSLQRVDWEIRQIGNQAFVVYTAAAYREPGDEKPGIGTAWEPFPGTTPYTRNSELMNAETAAWGRAIVALGLTANRKIASRQEVRARQEERETPKSDIPSDLPWEQPHSAPQPAQAPVADEDDPMPAEMLMAEIKRQGGMKVQEFREWFAGFDVPQPGDVASAEKRRNYLAALSPDDRVRIAQALVERAKTLQPA